MLDIKFIRENQVEVENAIKYKKIKLSLKKLLKVDEKRRELLKLEEELNVEKNKTARLGKDGIKEGRRIKDDLHKLSPKIEKINKEFFGLMYLVPNPPAKDVPRGRNEEDNIVIRKVSGIKLQVNDKEIKDHAYLGRILDIIDTEQAGTTSGSRFSYFKNEMVLMQFALINWVMETLLKENFIPIIPPVIEKMEVARGTGYFEALMDDAYHLKDEDAILVGTSEQSVVPYEMGKILNLNDLPKRYLGYSTCFRREAGSYGKDVTGIFRQHQFDKLEMVSFTTPENSDSEHEKLLEIEEKIMKELKLPYQVIKMCSGDLGLPAVRKYDIEAWIPSQNKYRETHSVSSCTDFQARRLNIRFRNKENKPEFAHILNGTAIAMGRMLIAIMENYQLPDGSVAVPKVLQKYLTFKKITPKNINK